MKQLLIVRHAKSDKDNPGLDDFERPLNARGKKNAPEMAQRMLKKKLIPEQIVSSPAKRAITTAEYFAEAFDIKKTSILREPQIYEASSATLMRVINKLPKESDFIAMFGHNPGITDVVARLTGTDLINIPTCGIVLIEFPFDDWEMISQGTGELKMYDYPKKED